MNHSEKKGNFSFIFDYFSYFNNSDSGLRAKYFFLQLEPDPNLDLGSQNAADPDS